MPEITSALTDGTGVSDLTLKKLLKDAALDFLLSVPAAFVAINVLSLEAALAVPSAVAFAVGDVVLRVAYRAALKYFQS